MQHTTNLVQRLRLFFFNHIWLTRDESWVNHWNHEIKTKSMQKHKGISTPEEVLHPDFSWHIYGQHLLGFQKGAAD